VHRLSRWRVRWSSNFVALAALSLLLAWANRRMWSEDHRAETSAVPLGYLTATAIALRLAPMVVWSTALYARRPSVVAPMAGSSTRSNAISTPTAPSGILAPGALTYRVACQEWFTQGVRANRYLPTIWATRWSAEHVSRHSS
jgi:hypothetical protein